MKGASIDELIAHCAAVASEIRWSASICRRRSAASRCRWSSGGALPRSRTSWRSRSRRSTVTRRSTSCTAWSRREPRSGSRSTPATTITSCSISRCPSRATRRRGGAGAHQRRAARPLERVDAQRGRQLRAIQARRRARRRIERSCWRSMRASPTATARSSTSRTISLAASPAATRCCAGRGCSKAPGAWTRTRRCRPGRPQEIDRVYREHGDLSDDAFVRANLDRWLVMSARARTLTARRCLGARRAASSPGTCS